MKNPRKKLRNLVALVGIGLSSFFVPSKAIPECDVCPDYHISWEETFDSGISRPYTFSHPDKWLFNRGLEARDFTGESGPIRLSFNDRTYRFTSELWMEVACSKSAWSDNDRLCIEIGDDANNASGTYWEFCINAHQENPHYSIQRTSPEFNYTFVKDNHPAIVPGGTNKLRWFYYSDGSWYLYINGTRIDAATTDHLNRYILPLEGRIGVSVYASMGDVARFNNFRVDYYSVLDAVGFGGLSLEFTRGDNDEDGRVNICDPIKTLTDLFEGGELGEGNYCWDRADTNDNGKVNIIDPIYTLAFLFLGGHGIPPPYYGLERGTLARGIDTTEDAIYCRQE